MSSQLGGGDLSNRQFFIRRWEQEYRAFIDVIRAVPHDQLAYRPHPDRGPQANSLRFWFRASRHVSICA
ncbi:MAG TPA: hypothetical protein VKY31_10595 [Terriglobia bacterium]|nr:hypothetical protein [Terriglobia bacterium]